MLIVRKRKTKEVSKEARAKRRKRAALLRLVLFSTLIAGLLGFFAYSNSDYFLSLWESVVASREAKPSGPVKPQREYKSASELLGLPEFFDTNDASPLNTWIAEHRQLEPEPEQDTSSRIHQAVLSQPSREAADTAKADTLTRPLAVRTEPAEPEAVKADTLDRQTRLTPAADTATRPQAPVVPPPSPVAAVRDSAEAKKVSLASTPPKDTAAAERIKPEAGSITPQKDTTAAERIKPEVGSITPPKDTAAVKRVKTEAGSMVISNIRCRLADRDDISIDVSVELFYDDKALQEELNFKRGTLATVLGVVMRRQEFGSVAMPALSGELLDAFNDVLTSGQLSKVDVRNFSVAQ